MSARGVVVSNIAWAPAFDDAVAALLVERGVAGVEVAPTTRWPDLRRVAAADATAWRAEWAERGLPVRSMQSLLFGRPELRVFGTREEQDALVEFLDHVCAIAAALGAGPLVFGSPANRRRDDRDMERAMEDAAPVFARMGAAAHARGVVLCIEPNPPQYGCDFLTDTTSAVSFLEHVDAPGLGLHLDAAALALNGEDVERAVERAAPWLRHYHASEPFLAPVGTPGVAHARHADALRAVGYAGLVSIEMKSVPDADEARTLAHVASALDVVMRAYHGVSAIS